MKKLLIFLGMIDTIFELFIIFILGMYAKTYMLHYYG